jgi:uncharacterized protein (TIGR03663 family)
VTATEVPQDAAAPKARSRRPRGELIAYGVLVAVALALRFYDLGDRPFHHDESQDAYFSYTFWKNGGYEYDPLLHGPLRFYLTAAMYTLFGDSDFTARLAPALMGTLMVPLPYLLRDQLGRVGAFSAAVALAIGPSYLYFSRFAREDIYFAAITLALLVVVFRFLSTPRQHHPALIAVLLALSFAIKETTFITLFVAGTFFIVVLISPHRDLVIAPVRAVGLVAWGWALIAFLGIYTILFTTFLTYPEGAKGLWTGLDYWLGQHEVGRGGESRIFYGVILGLIEWPAVVLGAIGAVVAIRRPTLLRVFLVWAFVVSLIVYSWAGEKFAWLVLHPLLPLLLLAGVGVQAIWDARRHWYGRVGFAVTVACLAYVVFASYGVNALRRADPRELLVSTQSSEEVAKVADQVVAKAKAAEAAGRPFSVTIDSAEGATFPWAWYFRDLQTGYIDLGGAANAPPADSDVLILTQGARDRLDPDLRGTYAGREFPFRVWWVREYDKLRPGSAWRYLTKREPWNPTGGMPEFLYERR